MSKDPTGPDVAGSLTKFGELMALPRAERAIALQAERADKGMPLEREGLGRAFADIRSASAHDLKEKRNAFRQKREAYEQQLMVVESDARTAASRTYGMSIWRYFMSGITEELGRQPHLEEAVTDLESAAANASRIRVSARKLLDTPWTFLWLTVLSLVIASIARWGTSGAVSLVGITPAIAHYTRRLRDFAAVADGWRARVEAALVSSTERLETNVEELVAEAIADDEELATRRAQLDAAQARLGDEEELDRLLSEFVSMSDFVRARIADRAYEDELGLMHQVGADLEQLSRALTPPLGIDSTHGFARLFPRGEPRVVLFIDDLDRCPPNRVVEVFEAIQLILRRPLFVVVTAIDDRYVTRSLEHKYKGILEADRSPTGYDYLEKIIQIPYRVRPVDGDALGGFLTNLMNIPRADGSAVSLIDGETTTETGAHRDDSVAHVPPTPVRKAIEFSSEERDHVREVVKLGSLTPRSIKRVVNVLKLVKLVRETADKPLGDKELQTVAALLVFSSAHRLLMRSYIRQLKSVDRQSMTLGEFLEGIPNADHSLIKDLPLGELDESLRSLTSSVCFTGSIEEPATPSSPPTRIAELAGTARPPRG
jgi:hypothetical protein